MRILFVGDSMTIGSAGEYTWRYHMWQHLNRSHGRPYRIVGPRTALYDQQAGKPVSQDYADPGFPEHARAHLAGWGEGWLQMVPLIRETVAAHRAGVLLVSLGLIDLGFYTNAEQTAGNVRRFIAEARAANPAVRMLIMPVLPNVRAADDPAFGAEVRRFNALLTATASELGSPASPVVLAGPPADWDLHRDTYDGTHPSARGEHRLAAAFADALYEEWGVGAPYETRLAAH